MGEAYQISDQYATYFLTFQVVGWADVFTRQDYRDIVIESFKYCQQHKQLSVHAFVIMTNHIHCILSSESGKLSESVRDFKKFTASSIISAIQENHESRKEWLMMIFEYHSKFNKRTNKNQFWTHENHAVLLDTHSMIETRLDYIHQNPVQAGWVDHPDDYIYSSSRNYSGEKGLLEINVLV